ncbi:MAG: cell division protein [Proteobacteria bacterium]|jgi:cell division protein FtsN|nr:cell division protein [Pseudomonadota bacterium]
MKDFKPRPKAKKRGSTLVGVFIGLLLGLGIAVAVAIYVTKAPIPFVQKQKPAERPSGAPPTGTESSKDAPRARAEEKHAAVSEKDKPRFDFYKILPGQEEPVTEKQVRDAAKDAGKPGAAKETYVIQAGAFQNPADADNLKAKLAFMGLEAAIEPTNLPDRGTWYRVRLGPYTRLDEINRVRQQLAQSGVDATLVKLKDTKP